MLEKEFSSAVEGHIPSSTQNALKFTRDAEDVDDLVQDTLVKAIRFCKSMSLELI